MRKFLLPVFVLMAMLVSCSGDDNGSDSPEVKNELFYGGLSLNGSLVSDDAKCTLDIMGDSASIILHAVTFAPTMPAMDIVIPALNCEKNGDAYIISGKGIVPTVMGAPMERYTMSSVDACLIDGVFTLSAVMPMGTIGFSNATVEPEPGIKPVSGKHFKGALSAGDFTMETVVDVLLKDSVSKIILNDVKFAENMPVVIDITLADVPYTVEAGEEYVEISFVAENVVPFINTGTEPVPAYTFASVEGRISGDRLSLSAKMADDLAPYIAGKEFVFDGKVTVE